MTTKLKKFNPEPLKYNQLFVFPNTYQAPTTAGQIPTANYTAPWLSRSLFEEDPRRKLRLREFLNTIRFTMYKMTRGETEQIFAFADQNHDDLLDQREWDAFTALFVFPFEACDVDGDYILTEEEFKSCWDADPRSKLISFRRRFNDKKYRLVMDIVSTKGKTVINFSDYLFIRRSLFAWQECHSGEKFIAMSAFKCAIRVAVPQKYHLKVDHERMYIAGLNLANDPNLIEMDYVSYLRIVYFTYVFSIFGLPHDIPWLEKTQFIKAVKEDRFPTNFDQREIEGLYDLVNINPFQKDEKMSYESFVFFFNLHRLFNRYSIQKPLQLSEDELLLMLDDYLTPYRVVLSIDLSKTDFKESEFQEVSMILQRLRLNERDFYYSFKSKEKLDSVQDASVYSASVNNDTTINATYYDTNANKTNRHFFFTILCGIDKRFWTKEIMYRTFQWANIFTELAVDKRWIVPGSTLVERLPVLYETAHPPIGMLYRDNFVVYKSIPRDINMDLLSFVSLENWRFKFNLHKLSTNEMINETLLKIILKDYGMGNMPDSVIDVARNGYDIMRRRLYIPSEVIKYMIIIQCAAAENLRNLEYIEAFSLKLNDDYSRKFPNWPRRHMSSPLV